MTFDEFINTVWYKTWLEYRTRLSKDKQLIIFGECVSDFEKRYIEENK